MSLHAAFKVLSESHPLDKDIDALQPYIRGLAAQFAAKDGLSKIPMPNLGWTFLKVYLRRFLLRHPESTGVGGIHVIAPGEALAAIRLFVSAYWSHRGYPTHTTTLANLITLAKGDFPQPLHGCPVVTGVPVDSTGVMQGWDLHRAFQLIECRNALVLSATSPTEWTILPTAKGQTFNFYDTFDVLDMWNLHG